MRKKKWLALSALLGATTILLTSCSGLGGDLLVKPAKAESLEYTAYTEDGFVAFKSQAEQFSAKLASGIYQRSEKEENLAVAPNSVFMALSLVSECAGGETKTELLNALGVSESAIETHLPTLYRAMNQEYKSVGIGSLPTTGLLKTSNSIWIDESVTYKQSCVEMLANDYYCYPYKADFKNKNGLANYAVRNFVKEQTKGLVDEDFNLSEETLFTLINTMYLKALWNVEGDKIPLTNETYNFKESSGEIEQTKLMQRGYYDGRAQEYETFTTFYTKTYNGFKIKFLLPKEGYTVDDIFTADNIYNANNTEYEVYNDEEMKHYLTRCFFPQYEAECDENIQKVLTEDFGVNSLFEWGSCDLSGLTDTPVVCGEVRHVTELTVDRRGIEGAAVTHIPMAGAPGPGEYERVYFDFIVDRAFGFIVTDSHDITLFSGVVHEL